MAHREIPSELAEILDRMSLKGGQDAADAATLREALRADPLFVMLADTNRDVVESMRAVAKDVPEAIRDGSSEVRAEVRAGNRNVLVVVVVCLCLMAGLVGTSIVLDRSGVLRVNGSTTDTVEPDQEEATPRDDPTGDAWGAVSP